MLLLLSWPGCAATVNQTQTLRCGLSQPAFTLLYNESALVLATILSPSFANGTVQSFVRNNFTLSGTDLQPSLLLFVFNTGPFLVLVLALLLLAVPMLGCCWFPAVCPGRYLSKNEREDYSEDELYRPFIIATVLLLIACACGAAGFLLRDTFTQGIASSQCSQANYLQGFAAGANGTTPQNKSTFFRGFLPIRNTTSYLLSNYSAQLSRFQSAYSQIAGFQSSIASALAGVDSVFASYSDVTYTNAFTDSGGTVISVPSQLKGLFLGPSTKVSSICGRLSASIKYVQGTLATVLTPVSQALASLSAVSPSSVLAPALPVLDSINQELDQLSQYIPESPYPVPFQIQRYALLVGSALLALAPLLALLTSLGVALGGRRWTFVLHFLSLKLLFAAALCCSVLGVYFGFATVSAFLQCQYTSQALTLSYSGLYSARGFYSLQPFLSSCTGNSSFTFDPLTPVGSGYKALLANFKTLSQTAQSFAALTASYSQSNLTDAIAAAQTTLSNIKLNKNIDVNDSRALIFLNNLANRQLPAGTCDPTLQYDTWLPTLGPSCPSGSVQRPPCSNIGSTSSCPLGCYSFTETMDTTGVQGDTAPGADQWLTKLKTRYGASCNYARYLSDIKNYDSSRIAAVDALKILLDTGVFAHMRAAGSAMTALTGSLATLSAELATSPHFSQAFGSTSGISCQAMQSRAQLVQRSFCVYNLVGSYLMLLLLGLGACTSASGLFLQLCGTSRKQLQKKKVALRLLDLSKATLGEEGYLPESELYRVL